MASDRSKGSLGSEFSEGAGVAEVSPEKRLMALAFFLKKRLEAWEEGRRVRSDSADCFLLHRKMKYSNGCCYYYKEGGTVSELSLIWTHEIMNSLYSGTSIL